MSDGGNGVHLMTIMYGAGFPPSVIVYGAGFECEPWPQWETPSPLFETDIRRMLQAIMDRLDRLEKKIEAKP